MLYIKFNEVHERHEVSELPKTLLVSGSYKYEGKKIIYDVWLFGQSDRDAKFVFITSFKHEGTYNTLIDEAKKKYFKYFNNKNTSGLISLEHLTEIK